ncbi:MAG: hypothetical protein OJF50_000759 [Nitrospira sp.]|nr:hypothetical protein [Nitrospira sp.]
MAAVTRWVRIIAASHRVGIPERATSALYTDFASSQIIDNLLRPLLCFFLRRMNGTRSSRPGFLHSPALLMPHDEAIILAIETPSVE